MDLEAILLLAAHANAMGHDFDVARRLATRAAESANRPVGLQPFDGGGREITIGKNDLLPYSFFMGGLAAGKSVAKVLLQCL